MNSWPPIKRFLRQPAVILGEIAAITGAGACGAVWPERHVFQTWGFAAVTLLTAGSLAVVVMEQFRRMCLQWRAPQSPARFASAPFQLEFERAATGPARVRTWSERRAGSCGSMVFHLGLLLLILAGAWRALFVRTAATDLMEGETLAPGVAWSAQWPGVFGQPLRLAQPLTLESVSGRRYADGNLRELRARLSAGEIAVNHQLYLGGSQIYLSQEFGPAALLEWSSGRRDAVLLAGQHEKYSAETSGPDDTRVFLHCNGERPAGVEIRIMRGNVLLAAATLGVGERLPLPGGASLALRGLPMWARLLASHDSALWLAGLGLILTMAGALLMFCLVRLDFCVVVTPMVGREKVFLALMPQRFAPLFQERFDAFVREQARENAAPAPAPAEVPPLAGAESFRVCRRAVLLMLPALLVFATGCGRVSSARAKELVGHYNQVVSDAYRRGDVSLIDPVVGPNEGRRLTGLIGVRLDLGITLDAHLLSLEVTRMEQTGRALQVHTREQWSYRDLRIGTGEPVGETSKDDYEMTYYFTNLNKSWLVDEIQFAAPPRVSRTHTPWITDHQVAPGATQKDTP